MTERLKTLMDEATTMDFAAPDLASIYRDGDRTVRRRRLVTGSAALASAAVAVIAVVAVAGGGDDSSRLANDPPDTTGMSWAVGSRILEPGSAVETGHPVRAYVRTTEGYVTADREGVVRSVVDGRVRKVGTMTSSSLYLVSDDEDSLAAWLEPGGDGSWEWVVLDQTTGERIATYPAGAGRDVPGVVVALDQRRLFVSTVGRYAEVDVTGEVAVTSLEAPQRGANLLAAEDGVLVWATQDDDGESEYVLTRPGAEPVVVPEVQGSAAALSPDGEWVAFDADELKVHDARTGDEVTVDIGDRAFASGFEFLDEDTLAVIASAGEVGPVELLACDLPTGRCSVVEDDLGTFDELLAGGFAVAVGTEIDE